jgi:hypothetical protein
MYLELIDYFFDNFEEYDKKLKEKFIKYCKHTNKDLSTEVQIINAWNDFCRLRDKNYEKIHNIKLRICKCKEQMEELDPIHDSGEYWCPKCGRYYQEFCVGEPICKEPEIILYFEKFK